MHYGYFCAKSFKYGHDLNPLPRGMWLTPLAASSMEALKGRWEINNTSLHTNHESEKRFKHFCILQAMCSYIVLKCSTVMFMLNWCVENNKPMNVVLLTHYSVNEMSPGSRDVMCNAGEKNKIKQHLHIVLYKLLASEHKMLCIGGQQQKNGLHPQQIESDM